MENQFIKYYGEYSLLYWIKLLLKSDIVLPEFQRPYVWTKEQIISLMNSLSNNQFVSPIIIGKYVEYNSNKRSSENNDKNSAKTNSKEIDPIEKNYILDGQQRLLSLLLVYLSIFPKIKDEFTYNFDDNVRDDSNDDDNQAENKDKVFSTNKILDYIQTIIEKCDISDKSELKDKLLKEEIFEKWEYKIEDKIFKDKFLPFIYIKPIKKITKESEFKNEKEYYAKLFYNINAKGEALSVQDSRNAIIWSYGGEIADFLKTEIKIKVGKEERHLDLLYYLSITSYMYKQVNDNNKSTQEVAKLLLKGKTSKSQKEQFILDFVNNINDKEHGDDFGDFNKIFSNNTKLKEKLEKYINELSDKEKFHYDSIEDFEYRFFGILYWGIFNGKVINISSHEKKVQEYLDKIHESFKGDVDKKNNYYKSINNIKVLRERVQQSINIYGDSNERI